VTVGLVALAAAVGLGLALGTILLHLGAVFLAQCPLCPDCYQT
jgi:hypothetical protein